MSEEISALGTKQDASNCLNCDATEFNPESGALARQTGNSNQAANNVNGVSEKPAPPAAITEDEKKKWLDLLHKGWATRSHEGFVFEEGNVAQLEAVVEFYINYDDPWAPGNPKVLGANAPATKENYEFYTTVNLSSGLHLVLIDAFGPRVTGNNAQTDPQSVGNVKLDINANDFKKINADFDTVYFPQAKGRKTFRIEEKEGSNSIALDIEEGEDISGIAGSWQIPAGVGGTLPAFVTGGSVGDNLGPITDADGTENYDHYDGVMFVIKDNYVRGKFRFTSYASYAYGWKQPKTGTAVPRNKSDGYYVADKEYVLSIRGNKDYQFESMRADSYHINYAFKIGSGLTIPETMRLYYADVVENGTFPRFSNDAWDVFIHYGFPGIKSGSASCQVSPDFFKFRAKMIELYREDIDKDDAAEKLIERALENSQDPRTDVSWNRKIRGTYWLIRPDERSLG